MLIDTMLARDMYQVYKINDDWLIDYLTNSNFILFLKNNRTNLSLQMQQYAWATIATLMQQMLTNTGKLHCFIKLLDRKPMLPCAHCLLSELRWVINSKTNSAMYKMLSFRIEISDQFAAQSAMYTMLSISIETSDQFKDYSAIYKTLSFRIEISDWFIA